MDQLKVILAHVQKHHFWLLSIVAIIAGMVGWMAAGKSLSAEYDKKKANIVSKFGKLQGIPEPHPNDDWKKEVDELTTKEKTTVTSVWKTVYDEQKKLLQWPEELGDAFLEFVNNSPPDAKFSPTFLRTYQEQISSEFPHLLKIVDAAPSEAPATQADKGRAGAEPHEYKVVWDSPSQKEIKDALNFEDQPTSEQVRTTQEDLWVYEALLNIIKAVNEKPYVAPVRQIAVMQIGQPAAAASKAGMAPGHIVRLSTAPAGTPSAGLGGGAPGLQMGAQGGDASAAKAAADRYVDADGNPLPSETANKAEFKRMPIFLRLIVDQRELPKLLVECANSPLPVEVRQLRINPSKQGAGTVSGPARPAASSPGAGNLGVGSSVFDRMGGANRAPSRPAAQAPAAGALAGAEASEAYAPVELHGIIYIYNQPDLDKIGGQAVAAAAPAR